MSVEDSGQSGGQWSCVWRTVVMSVEDSGHEWRTVVVCVEDSGHECGGQWS